MNSSTTNQKTFILLKPDAVKRALVGKIISRFEDLGLTITALKMLNVDKSLAEKHYGEHNSKDFFQPLVDLLTSAPVIILAVEGANAIEVARKIIGNTEPLKAAPGTIRGDYTHMNYARSKERLGVIPNLIHASDSIESAQRELDMWFNKKDFVSSYDRGDATFH